MGLIKSNFYKKPEVKIEVSVDDGGKLDLIVAELLTKYEIQGTFYIVVDWIGTERHLNWEDIKKLNKEGFIIGSHTITHPSDLKMLFDDQLHYEIQNSKDILETALGHNITSFCYPRGRADERIKRKVIEAGYINARGTGKPGITKIDDNFYLPGTIHIFQREEYEGVPVLDYAKKVIDKVFKEGGYCNVWMHSLELEREGLFGVLEDVLKYISEKRKEAQNDIS